MLGTNGAVEYVISGTTVPPPPLGASASDVQRTRTFAEQATTLNTNISEVATANQEMSDLEARETSLRESAQGFSPSGAFGGVGTQVSMDEVRADQLARDQQGVQQDAAQADTARRDQQDADMQADQGLLDQTDAIAAEQRRQVDTVADLFQQSGLAGLGQQFQRRRLQQLSETARKGLLGSSIDMSRQADLRQDLQSGVSQIANQAANIRQQGALGAIDLQGQLGGQILSTPLQDLERNLTAQGIRRQASNIVNMTEVQQNQEAIDSGRAQAATGALGNLIDAAGTGTSLAIQAEALGRD